MHHIFNLIPKHGLFMRTLTFFLALFAFIAFFSTNARAAGDRCPRHQVKTNLKSKLAGTRVFKGSVNSFSDYVLGHNRGNSRVLGFVNQSDIYTSLSYKFDVTKVGGNLYCVNLAQVDGYFYAAPKLYLPTDYSKNSCEYKQIYKHEQRHLKVVYDFHKRNSGKYAAQLGRIARTIPIFPPASTKAGVEKTKHSIRNYYESKFRKFEKQSKAELNAMQHKIDSPSEYIGVRKRCSNW